MAFGYRRVSTGAEFSAVMVEFANALQEDFEKVLKKLALDAFRSVIRRSAHDFGYMRHNWDIAIDSAPAEEIKESGGGATFGIPQTPSISVKFDSIIVIYNNTRYVIHLENGTPTNRAQPMIKPTEIQLRRTVERLFQGLSRKGYRL